MTAAKGKRQALGASLVLLVVATFAIASTVERSNTRSEIDAWVDAEAELVQEHVTEAIDAVLADLESVAAFVKGGNPTYESFATFVQEIDGTAHALGIGYTAAVMAESFDAFVASQKAIYGPEYKIFGLNPDGTGAPLDKAGRTIFFPVEFFAVGDLIAPLAAETDETFGRGFDAGYNESWRAESTRALAADGPTLSPFIGVDINIISLERVFFASVPVRADDGSTAGLVQALMLEQLLLPDVDAQALDAVDWEVVPQGTSPTGVDPDLAQVYPLEVPGTTWSLAIAPTEESLAELRGLPWWVTGLIAASLAFFAVLALWLFIDRRVEHRRAARLEQLALDKDRFLASVSHELRTPLTVVSGLANELVDQPDSFSSDEREGLMTMLVEQTDELSGIVEDLLIAARTDIGMVAIHHSNVDLGAEAARALKASATAATTRGVPGHAFADPQRVRQILRNLLTNAKRYGGPKIRIDFAEGAGWTEVVVADNGEGVPRDKREAIFQSYEIAHDDRATVGSVGLGLYISRTLARAMRGDLEYVYDGTWSHFRLRLPSAPGLSNGTDDPAADEVSVTST